MEDRVSSQRRRSPPSQRQVSPASQRQVSPADLDDDEAFDEVLASEFRALHHAFNDGLHRLQSRMSILLNQAEMSPVESFELGDSIPSKSPSFAELARQRSSAASMFSHFRPPSTQSLQTDIMTEIHRRRSTAHSLRSSVASTAIRKSMKFCEHGDQPDGFALKRKSTKKGFANPFTPNRLSGVPEPGEPLPVITIECNDEPEAESEEHKIAMFARLSQDSDHLVKGMPGTLDDLDAITKLETEASSYSSNDKPKPKKKVMLMTSDTASARLEECETASTASMIINFEVLDIWHSKPAKKFKAKTKSKIDLNTVVPEDALVMSGSLGSANSTDFDDAAARRRCRCWPKRCLSPNDWRRGMWDICSCLLVGYDMVMIPLELMDPGESTFIDVMAWITRIFWTIDMPLSMITGYVSSDGSLQRSVPRVLSRYLRSWFAFDLLIVSLEWLELLWSAGSNLGFMKFGRTSRAVRIIRMFRLLRLIRIREVISVIAERIRSERLIIAADVAKVMCIVVSLAHVMACLWYGVGNSDSPDGTWIEEFNITNSDLATRYAAAMHWSLAQFSGGMDEIKPANTQERYFTIAAFLTAFLMASVLISRLTSSMTRLHMLSNKQAQHLVVLRRYLAENHISHRVALRVQKNAQHAILEQQRFMPEEKVDLLQLISEPLRMEVHFELYYHVLKVHPFFHRYMEECPHVMRKVTHTAVAMVNISVGDLLFTEGEIPDTPRVFFVNSGTLEYLSSENEHLIVGAGQWISEMVLWTPWMHRGTLLASSNCRMAVLDAKIFQNIASLFDHTEILDPRQYALHYVKELNSREDEITDLCVIPFPVALFRDKERSPQMDLQGGVVSTFLGKFTKGHDTKRLEQAQFNRIHEKMTRGLGQNSDELARKGGSNSTRQFASKIATKLSLR